MISPLVLGQDTPLVPGEKSSIYTPYTVYVHNCVCIYIYIHMEIYETHNLHADVRRCTKCVCIYIYIHVVDYCRQWRWILECMFCGCLYTCTWTGKCTREMVGRWDISEPVAELLPYFVCVCVWYKIRLTANHATIFVQCRSVDSLQGKPSITSASSPFPFTCVEAHIVPCLFVFMTFWLKNIDIRDSASWKFAGYMMWCALTTLIIYEHQTVAIKWLSKSMSKISQRDPVGGPHFNILIVPSWISHLSFSLIT